MRFDYLDRVFSNEVGESAVSWLVGLLLLVAVLGVVIKEVARGAASGADRVGVALSRFASTEDSPQIDPSLHPPTSPPAEPSPLLRRIAVEPNAPIAEDERPRDDEPIQGYDWFTPRRTVTNWFARRPENEFLEDEDNLLRTDRFEDFSSDVFPDDLKPDASRLGPLFDELLKSGSDERAQTRYGELRGIVRREGRRNRESVEKYRDSLLKEVDLRYQAYLHSHYVWSWFPWNKRELLSARAELREALEKAAADALRSLRQQDGEILDRLERARDLRLERRSDLVPAGKTFRAVAIRADRSWGLKSSPELLPAARTEARKGDDHGGGANAEHHQAGCGGKREDRRGHGDDRRGWPDDQGDEDASPVARTGRGVLRRP